MYITESMAMLVTLVVADGDGGGGGGDGDCLLLHCVTDLLVWYRLCYCRPDILSIFK